MPETIINAINMALTEEMERDERVVVFGEDVAETGGVFRATEGLKDKFGGTRVVDTPLSEIAIAGGAVGLAVFGLRPVAEIQFSGFLPPAFDQLVTHASRMRWRTRGEWSAPMVVRTPYGAGIRALEHHSESLEGAYAHIPGLKVVIPSTPYDSKGLLKASIRDPDPVLFMEPKHVYRSIREDVPDDPYAVELGSAAVRREGTDVSLFTWGAMARPTLAAAEDLAEEGIDCEVVDLRTLSPLDEDAIKASFEKTGRAVVVHEAPKTGGLAGEIIATIQEDVLLYQEAPIARVTGFDVPFPLYALEDYYLPEPARIKDQIRETVAF